MGESGGEMYGNTIRETSRFSRSRTRIQKIGLVLKCVDIKTCLGVQVAIFVTVSHQAVAVIAFLQ